MRVRRHVPGGASRERRVPTAVETQPQPSGPGRPWLRDALVVLATFGVGYVIASA